MSHTFWQSTHPLRVHTSPERSYILWQFTHILTVHTSSDSSHILWQFTHLLTVIHPLTVHTSSDISHTFWQSTHPLRVHTSSDSSHIFWQFTHPLTVHTSSDSSYIVWQFTYPLTVYISSDSSHILWQFTPSESSSIWQFMIYWCTCCNNLWFLSLFIGTLPLSQQYSNCERLSECYIFHFVNHILNYICVLGRNRQMYHKRIYINCYHTHIMLVEELRLSIMPEDGLYYTCQCIFL